MKRLLILSWVILIPIQVLFAQVSLVPAQHQVYEWLHYQRVLGNAPDYNYESLPLSRGKLTELIELIPEDQLSGFDRKLRSAYLRELSPDSLAKTTTRTLLQGSKGSFGASLSDKAKLFASLAEPHGFFICQ